MDILTHIVTAAAAATADSYIVAPCRLVLLGGYCVADYEAGADTTLSVINGSTEQIAFALDATTTLGAACEGTLSDTTIFEKGDVIKFTASDDEGAATGNINVVLQFDPFLAGVAGA